MIKITALPVPLRVFVLLFLLAGGLPLALGGCAFAPQIDVPGNAAQALAEGQAKEKAANAKAAANDQSEADRLRNDAAAYYGAVARKFAGTENGLRALIAQARLYEAAKNFPLAQNTYRDALRQYPPGAFPALHREAQGRYDALVARMDRDNAKTPYYQAMDALVRLVGGSHVLAIFIISIGVTLALWPLRAKQYRSMKEMQRHAPELKKIQEKYKGDKALQQEKVMEFYREHGFNPMAGCLPMLAQAPVLMLLYQVILHYQFQFAKSYFLWINPTTAAASANWPNPLTGAVARNLGEQDLPLLLVYALSMYFQTKLTPASDPAQAEQQKVMAVVMPAMFFVMMLQWHLPSAFVLYWFLSNVFAVAQQWWITRNIHLPPLPPAVDALGNGAVPPGDGPSPSNGSGAPAKPLAPNQKLISPKNRKRRK